MLSPVAVFGVSSSGGHVFELESEDQQVVGNLQTVTTRWEDTLLEIGRAHGIGYEEMRRANPGVDPWVPGEGTEVVIPTRFVLPGGPRRGVVINLPEYRLYYFPDPGEGEPRQVVTYPVSIGQMDWDTPIGRHRITGMRRNPSWTPPQSVREKYAADGRTLPPVVPPGPDNPMGSRAIRLSLPSYLIHGTNRPDGVGMRVTHGCIRMFPESVEALYDRLSVGTEVRIINQPYKVGWRSDVLYLEAHPPLEEYEEEFAERGLTVLTEEVVRATRDNRAVVDWRGAEFIAAEARGIPSAMASVDSETPQIRLVEPVFGSAVATD